MRRFHEFAELASTNTYLAENYRRFEPPVFIRALRQTAGRGRLERSWFSGTGGENLAMSALLSIKTENPALIPIVAGNAVFTALSRYARLQIKWPNDIYADGRKLGGILSERITSEKNLFVIGVGINANTTEFPTHIASTAASLRGITGHEFNLRALWVQLARALVAGFRTPVERLPADFIRNYNAHAWRYILRREISSEPLEFATLLEDGRAQFQGPAGPVILDMAD